MRFLLLALLLAGCGASPLNLLTGGGPNVAANVQAGKTNSQTLGQTKNVEQSVKQAETVRQSSEDNQVRADEVHTVVVNQTPIWLVIAFAIALFMDSPLHWPTQIYNAFKRK